MFDRFKLGYFGDESGDNIHEKTRTGSLYMMKTSPNIKQNPPPWNRGLNNSYQTSFCAFCMIFLIFVIFHATFRHPSTKLRQTCRAVIDRGKTHLSNAKN